MEIVIDCILINSFLNKVILGFMTNIIHKKNESVDKDIFAIIICLCIVIPFLVYHLSNSIKLSKGHLMRYYGVDNKTFNKWFQYFCPHILDVKQFKKQRKIKLHTYWRIKLALGNTSEFSTLRKIEIINLCDSDYRTLRKNINIAPSSIGMNISIYNNLSVFPPKVCKSIVDWYK